MENQIAITTAVWVAGITAGLSSVPHCMAMCGPIAAISCQNQKGQSSMLKYQLGRLISYSSLGAATGFFSKQLLDGLPTQYVKPVIFVFLGISLLWVAVRLWRASNRNKIVSLHRKNYSSNTRSKNEAKLFTSKRLSWMKRFPFLVGLGTAFLPCGALASALLIAMSTASMWDGAISMALFSLSSGLGFWALGWVLRIFQSWNSAWSKRVLSTLFALCGILVLLRAWNPLHHSLYGNQNTNAPLMFGNQGFEDHCSNIKSKVSVHPSSTMHSAEILVQEVP